MSKEYIDRALCEKDAFTVHTKEYGNIDVISLEAIYEIPVADVVEVIRCKNCKNWDVGTARKMEDDSMACICRLFSFCSSIGIYTHPNGYCWGAKRDNDRDPNRIFGDCSC